MYRIKYKHESNLITLEELAEDVGLTYASTIRLVNRLGIKDIIKQKSSSKQEDENFNFCILSFHSYSNMCINLIPCLAHSVVLSL